MPEKCHMKKCMKRKSKVATFSHESQPAIVIVKVDATHQASCIAFLQTPALTIVKVHPSSIEIAPHMQQPLSMISIHSANPAAVMLQGLNAEQQHYQLQQLQIEQLREQLQQQHQIDRL